MSDAANEREELAARIYASILSRDDVNEKITARYSFVAADQFLAEAKRQREPEPKPPEFCDYCKKEMVAGDGHRHANVHGVDIQGCPKHPVYPTFTAVSQHNWKEPVTPRKPREWFLDLNRFTIWNAKPIDLSLKDASNFVHVREVLDPTDGE